MPRRSRTSWKGSSKRQERTLTLKLTVRTKKSSDSPGHVTGGGSGHVKLKKVTDYKLKKIVCPKKRGRHSHRKKRDSSVKPPTHATKSLKVKSLKARSTPQAEI